MLKLSLAKIISVDSTRKFTLTTISLTLSNLLKNHLFGQSFQFDGSGTLIFDVKFLMQEILPLQSFHNIFWMFFLHLVLRFLDKIYLKDMAYYEDLLW